MILKTLIHYGATTYDKSLVKPITNDNWVKPIGGLWTSPKDSNWGWKNWCESEDFADCKQENSCELILKDDAKIFVIDSLDNLLTGHFIQETFTKRYYLDFELMAKLFDAIWLTEKGQNETHYAHPINLYGWDCETVFIMNPECCKQIISNKIQLN